MVIRFNMQELIDDLMAEGCTRTLAVDIARQENEKRQKTIILNIKVRNDVLMERTNLIPKIFL